MKTKKIVKNLLIVLIIASNVGCDQISKNIVRHKVAYNEQIQVISNYLLLTKVENTGAFLGLGNSIPRWIYTLLMIVLPILAIGYALYYIIRKNDLSNLMTVGVSFFIGGGIGNIIDRILFGSVTDFLFFDFVIFHTGIVNMADIAVTLGFFIIIIESYISSRKHVKTDNQVQTT